MKSLKNYEAYFQRENTKLQHGYKTEEDDGLFTTNPLNDEDLLKACGGRTAHK